MTDINIVFSRELLKRISADVRKHMVRKAIRRDCNNPRAARAYMTPMKDAWVWHFHRDHWEFHGPDGFYWHGSADNAYDARAHGWSAWLRKEGAEGYEFRNEAA